MKILPSIRLRLFITALLLATAGVSRAQNLILIDFDTSNYPEISARFLLMDRSGRLVRNFDRSQFSVMENGSEVDSLSVSVSCPPQGDEQPFIGVLVNDRSGSMDASLSYNDPTRRFDLVKQGNIEFIRLVDFTPPTKLAITAFDQNPYIISDFASSPGPLIAAVNLMRPGGGTEYDPAFLDPVAGGIEMLSKHSFPLRKVLIFLTDGQPAHIPNVSQIVSRAQDANVQIYTITIGMPMTTELWRIANETGGIAFGDVNSVAQIQSIYKALAIGARGIVPCEIRWKSKGDCSPNGLDRHVAITHKPLVATATSRYLAPADKVARLELKPDFIWFGEIAPPNSEERQITLTARGDTMRITAGTIPTGQPFRVIDWGGVPPPFTLRKDESRTIWVRFTPTDTAVYTSHLELGTSPCPNTFVTLSGGLRRNRRISNIKLLSPDGGETFAGCDSIRIRWGGVPPTDTVMLEYSADNGTTWRTITQTATGLAHTWMPPAPGNRYRVRVSLPIRDTEREVYKLAGGPDGPDGGPAERAKLISPVSVAYHGEMLYVAEEGDSRIRRIDLGTRLISTIAGSSGGGSPAELWNPHDVTVSENGRYLYIADYTNNRVKRLDLVTRELTVVAGNGESGFSIDGEKAIEARMRFPSYVATRGNMLYISEDGTDRVLGVDLNTGILSVIAGGVKTPTPEDLNRDNAPAGSVALRKPAGLLVLGDSLYIVEQGAHRIRVVNLRTRIITTAAGSSTGAPGFSGDNGPAKNATFFNPVGVAYHFGRLYLTDAGNHRIRQIDLKTGIIRTIAGTGVATSTGDEGPAIRSTFNYPAKPATSDYALFVPDLRSDPDRIRVITLGVEGGEAFSRSTFSVSVSTLRLKHDNIDMGTIALGRSTDTILKAELCNAGSLPLNPDTVVIVGAHAADFRVVPLSKFDDIMPGDCRPVEILFNPSGSGLRTAYAIFYGRCATGDTLYLTGTGQTPCGDRTATSWVFGKTAVGSSELDTIKGAICNGGSSTLEGFVTLASPDRDFELVRGAGSFRLAPGTCLDLIVRFVPKSDGYANASIDYGGVAECRIPLTMLYGQGVEGATVVAPDSLRLGVDICARAPRDTMIELRNLGTVPATVVDAVLEGDADFSLLPPIPTLAAPRVIPANGRDTLRLRFNPGTPGDRSTLVSVIAAGGDTLASIVIDARKDSVRLGASTSMILFPPDAGATYPREATLEVENTGTVAMLVNDGVIGGQDRTQFEVVPGQFPLRVGPGERGTIRVRVLAQAGDDPFQATMTLSATPGCDSPIVVDLFQAGVAPAAAAVAPEIADLICEEETERNVTITLNNIGGATLKISGVQIRNDAEGSFTTSYVPQPIPVGGSDLIPVRFAPKSPGLKTAELVLTTNSTAGETVVQLTGTRASAAFTLNGNDLMFIEVPVNTPAQQQVVLRNDGTAPLTWNVTGADGRFVVRSIVPPTTPVGGSSVVTISFTGGPEGYYDDTLTVSDALCGIAAPIRMSATVGVRAETISKLPRASADPGQRVDIPIRVEITDRTLFEQTGASDYRTTISFLGLVLLPESVAGATIENSHFDPLTGVQTMTLSGRYDPANGDTLATIRCLALLSDTTSTSLDFTSFVWDKPNVATLTIPGSFMLTGDCTDLALRVVAAPKLLKITPMPVADAGELQVELPEWQNMRVILVDRRGDIAARVAERTYEPGTHTIPFNVSALPSGVYTLLIETPFATVTEQVVVVR